MSFIIFKISVTFGWCCGIKSNCYMCWFFFIQNIHKCICKAKNCRCIEAFGIYSRILAECKVGTVYQCHCIEEEEFLWGVGGHSLIYDFGFTIYDFYKGVRRER